MNTDVQVDEGSKALPISIGVSKSDQTGPPTVFCIPVSGNPSLSCVTSVKSNMQIRPTNCIYFFCHQNGIPLKRGQFSGVLEKAV